MLREAVDAVKVMARSNGHDLKDRGYPATDDLRRRLRVSIFRL